MHACTTHSTYIVMSQDMYIRTYVHMYHIHARFSDDGSECGKDNARTIHCTLV